MGQAVGRICRPGAGVGVGVGVGSVSGGGAGVGLAGSGCGVFFGGAVGGDFLFECFGQDGGLVGVQEGVEGGHAVAAGADAGAAVAAGVFFAGPDRVRIACGDDLVGPVADGFHAGASAGFDGGQVVIDHVLLDLVQQCGVDEFHLPGQGFGCGLL